jgi:NAD(P)-dependent dehydrogenase (short-subunit alcohol dehydrogenase family)
VELQNRIALVTGGGRGIGREVALVLAGAGATIVVASRTESELQETAEEIQRSALTRALPVACDVAEVTSVQLLFQAITEALGRSPDILVNNAGIAESAPLTRTTDELWARHLSVNLSGTFFCMRAALPAMIESGWGRIINIASIAGKVGAPYISAYAASKHGVLGLTRSAALEVADNGITVNAICPGYVDTDMTSRAVANITAKTGRPAAEMLEALKNRSPQHRLITAEEVAAMALLLATEAGRGINGQAINIDGGSVQS